MSSETCNHIRVSVRGRGVKSGAVRAVAAASYRAGIKMEDLTYDMTHDYTRRRDVWDSEIMVPDHMKGVTWAQDREWLWNEVEARANYTTHPNNAQLYREVMIPLPYELSNEQRQELTRAYVKKCFVNEGMIADISYHNFEGEKKENPHAHVMLTLRDVTPEGFSNINQEWKRRENVTQWRQEWTKTANQMAKEWDIELGLDHRNYKDRGITKEAEQHMGRAVMEMEQRGIKTERGEYNRKVQEINNAKEQDKEQSQELSPSPQLEPKQQEKVPQPKPLDKKLQRFYEWQLTQGREVFEVKYGDHVIDLKEPTRREYREQGLASYAGDYSKGNKPQEHEQSQDNSNEQQQHHQVQEDNSQEQTMDNGMGRG